MPRKVDFMKQKKLVRVHCQIYEDSMTELRKASQNDKYQGRYQRLLRDILNKVVNDKKLLKEVMK